MYPYLSYLLRYFNTLFNLTICPDGGPALPSIKCLVKLPFIVSTR